MHVPSSPPSDQRGTAMVEFALAFMLFWTALIAVIEFARLMFSWGTASEATRIAARLASICDKTSTQQAHIRARVSQYLTASGQIDLAGRTDWLTISYFPTGCTVDTCQQVEAKLYNIHPNMHVPGLNKIITLPEFRMRLPRESMRNSIQGENNNACI